MSMRAGIDVGTNAVKCCVARVENGRVDVLREMRAPTRLGEGFAAGGRLRPLPMARTCAAVHDMILEAVALGAKTVRVAGTSACREAANTHELAACLEEACGVALEILSGEDEARLSFLAVTRMEGVRGPAAVFDTGGGSTDWAMGADGRLAWALSLPLGAVRLTEMLLAGDPVPPERVSDAAAHVRDILAALPDVGGARLFGTGGGLHTMARVHAEHAGLAWDAARMLSRDEVDRQMALYAALNTPARAAIPGMDPARADIMPAGALIVRGCMEAARAESLTVSDAGARHGLVLEG